MIEWCQHQPAKDKEQSMLDPETQHYSEAVAQMADPDRYAELRALTFEERTPCPVKGCRLSSEEHHRLAFGLIAENRSLKRRVAELENGAEHADGDH